MSQCKNQHGQDQIVSEYQPAYVDVSSFFKQAPQLGFCLVHQVLHIHLFLLVSGEGQMHCGQSTICLELLYLQQCITQCD